jgi:hypothetical protein
MRNPRTHPNILANFIVCASSSTWQSFCLIEMADSDQGNRKAGLGRRVVTMPREAPIDQFRIQEIDQLKMDIRRPQALVRYAAADTESSAYYGTYRNPSTVDHLSQQVHIWVPQECRDGILNRARW